MNVRHASAVFSPDRVYRYSLDRHWGSLWGDSCATPVVAFIGLNPSTADETRDDPTIRRCVAFAMQWGYHGLIMLNLFAFRATDPAVLKRTADPVGPDNDRTIRDVASRADLVVAAWGAHGAFRERDRDVRRLAPRLLCFGTTKGGHPRHPLYLRKDTALEIYQQPPSCQISSGPPPHTAGSWPVL